MKSFFCFLLLLFCSLVSFAQESSLSRKNHVFVEGGGALAAGVGLGYERYLTVTRLSRFTARGGAGIIDHFSLPTFFVGSSFLFGNKFQAEVGVNYVTKIDRSNFKSLDEEDDRIVSGLQTIVGLRYQNWQNGLSFRVFYVPPFGPFGTWLPYGGVSLGYAF